MDATQSPTMIRMFPSGTLFDLANPRPQDIHIEDIAHHLSHINRFTGGTRVPYSVANHSIAVSDRLSDKYLDEHLALIGLLHDAQEAYVGDVSTPMKRAMRAFTGAFDGIETAVWNAVVSRFNLAVSPRDMARVKEADTECYEAECRALCGPNNPLPEGGRDHYRARRDFLGRFLVLGGRS